MQKVLGYGVMVLALWAVLELQTKGTRGAFGGRLSGWFAPVESVRTEPELPPRVTEQVRQRVEGTLSRYEQDRERQARGLP